MSVYWTRKNKKWKSNLAMVLLVVIALFGGILVGVMSTRETIITYNITRSEPEYEPVLMQPINYQGLPDRNVSHYVTMSVPAVDKDEKGVTTLLTVQAVPGSGRILADIDKLLFWTDTQNSIRRATTVAENVTGINVTDYDLIYTIQANASVIGGPSAGAALTMATIAALEDREINNSVMITGSINHDGTIGPVGSIFEKAVAAKQEGAKLFLVPLTQSSQIIYKDRQYCEKIGWMDFCTTETYPVKIDVEKDAGIAVIEVMTIEDAMKLMLVEK